MKEPDSYVFTAEANHCKQLDRLAITRDVNPKLAPFSRSLRRFQSQVTNRFLLIRHRLDDKKQVAQKYYQQPIQFPDWEERINYQKKQEKNYRSALNRIAEEIKITGTRTGRIRLF